MGTELVSLLAISLENGVGRLDIALTSIGVRTGRISVSCISGPLSLAMVDDSNRRSQSACKC